MTTVVSSYTKGQSINENCNAKKKVQKIAINNVLMLT